MPTFQRSIFGKVLPTTVPNYLQCSFFSFYLKCFLKERERQRQGKIVLGQHSMNLGGINFLPVMKTVNLRNPEKLTYRSLQGKRYEERLKLSQKNSRNWLPYLRELSNIVFVCLSKHYTRNNRSNYRKQKEQTDTHTTHVHNPQQPFSGK